MARPSTTGRTAIVAGVMGSRARPAAPAVQNAARAANGTASIRSGTRSTKSVTSSIATSASGSSATSHHWTASASEVVSTGAPLTVIRRSERSPVGVTACWAPFEAPEAPDADGGVTLAGAGRWRALSTVASTLRTSEREALRSIRTVIRAWWGSGIAQAQ